MMMNPEDREFLEKVYEMTRG